tara:strand:- start:331 stop:1047 length:717 start_codon:yes stop_codon:yes gene_type:complete
MKLTSSLPKILLWGAGSQARIVVEMLKENGLGVPEIIFDETLAKPEFSHSCFFTNDPKVLKSHLNRITHFTICIGNENGYARVMISRGLESLALHQICVVHKSSLIEQSSQVGNGSLIMPGAIVHKFSKIGSQVVLNTGSIVEHECVIGNGVHLMSGSVISGKVRIDDYVTIGTNATVMPYVHIGEGAYVGAGALVNKNVAPYAVVRGVPARMSRVNKLHFLDKSLNYICNFPDKFQS